MKLALFALRLLALFTLFAALMAAKNVVRSVKRQDEDSSNRKRRGILWDVTFFEMFVHVSSFGSILRILLTKGLSTENFATAFIFMAVLPLFYTIVLLAIAYVGVRFEK